MTQERIISTGSIFTTAVLAVALVGVALPAAAQTEAVGKQVPAVTHNTWTSGTPMPTARLGAATGVIKGKVYVVGGASSTTVLNVNEIYDPKKNTWTTGAPMPTARLVPASAVVNNILYVIGGCDAGCATGTGAMTVVEAYDPVTNTWSTKSPLQTPTDSVYGVAVKGIIYVVGGYVPGVGRVGTVYSYNPPTDTWSQEASMKVGKSRPALGALGSKIIAAGKFGNSGFVSDNESFTIAKNVWTTLAADPTARAAGCFWGIAGQLYVAGGGDNSGPLTLTEAYSMKTKSRGPRWPRCPRR